MIRLRQVAMIAPDLDPVVDELCATFGLRVCSTIPGVAEFGLRNALMLVGDQFIEVLSPTREGTTVQRLLDKRGGAGGYMAIFEVDDLDDRVERLAANDVRVVWAGDLPDIRGRHLHPAMSGEHSCRSTSRCRRVRGDGVDPTGRSDPASCSPMQR